MPGVRQHDEVRASFQRHAGERRHPGNIPKGNNCSSTGQSQRGLGSVSTALAGLPGVAPAIETYSFQRMWRPCSSLWYFNKPWDLAMDARGMSMSDYENHRIRKFSGDGVFITHGEQGPCNSQFESGRHMRGGQWPCVCAIAIIASRSSPGMACVWRIRGFGSVRGVEFSDCVVWDGSGEVYWRQWQSPHPEVYR